MYAIDITFHIVVGPDGLSVYAPASDGPDRVGDPVRLHVPDEGS